MPVCVRALHGDAHRPPQDAPYWIVDGLIKRLVSTMVKRAEIEYQVYDTLPEALRRRAAAQLEELWLEALLVPGTELRGRKRDLMSFAIKLGDWRVEQLYQLRKLELEDDGPAIALPPGGDRFWAGGRLPEPMECPAAPRRPAAILARIGKSPDWRAGKSLCESLEPVYSAASRYALESVFGRKI